MPKETLTKLQEALLWAAQLHADERRDGDVPLPYITHVSDVLSNLRYVGSASDETLLIVACLHDTVESGKTSLKEIQTKFGTPVANLVGELTRREPAANETSGMSKDEIWELRSSILLDEIAKMSPEAHTVKLADRLANLNEAFYTKKGPKLKRYIRQTERILQIIPRERNSGLWKEISALVKKIS